MKMLFLDMRSHLYLIREVSVVKTTYLLAANESCALILSNIICINVVKREYPFVLRPLCQLRSH